MNLELVRFDSDTHDIEELTALVQKAYKPLHESGLNFSSATDDSTALARKIEGRECWILRDTEIRATITVAAPGVARSSLEYYERPDVSIFNRLAVDPDRQHQRIGEGLVRHAEMRAKTLGARHLALDTAQPARGLIAWYQSLGFEQVGTVDWEFTNFTSVVLAKTLIDSSSRPK